MKRPQVLLSLALALSVASPVRAESPAAEPASPPAEPDGAEPADPTEPPDPKAEEARAHHRRGVALYDEGDYRLALVEFQRAYEIGRSHKVLFNIAQVHYQMQRYADARITFERYLREGGGAIAPERRAQVEQDLAALRARTATLTVRVNVPDAEITIGERSLGKGPVDRAVVDAGTLRVQAARPGYASRSSEVTLAGGDVRVVSLELFELRPHVVVAPQPEGLPGVAVAGWIATGVLAAGAVGAGVAASLAASSYETQRKTPISGSPAEARADLERQRDLVTGLALTTDALALAALITGGAALYFTVRGKPRSEPSRARAASAALTFGF